MSSDSTSENPSVTTFGIRGFPTKYACGVNTTIYTSETVKNPGRPFFRCLTRRKHHLFKWVEDVFYEEVQDALPKIVQLEAELNKEKSDVEDMKKVITEMMEELVRTKTEKIVFLIIFVITIVIVVRLM